MDGIFVGLHERTGASLFLSETWIAERYESSAENRKPKVGQ